MPAPTTQSNDSATGHSVSRPRLVAFGIGIFVVIIAFAVAIITTMAKPDQPGTMAPLEGAVPTTQHEQPVQDASGQVLENTQQPGAQTGKNEAGQHNASNLIKTDPESTDATNEQKTGTANGNREERSNL